MASELKNLSDYSTSGIPDVSNNTFALVVAEWNEEVTNSLYSGAYETLLKHGVKKENICKVDVPGSFELTFSAQKMAEKENIDAVICIGCVIQGETKHNDYINHAVAQGLTNVSIKYNKPVIFGVLTPDTDQQALDRAGGKYGNKGEEAAVAALEMIDLQRQF